MHDMSLNPEFIYQTGREQVPPFTNSSKKITGQEPNSGLSVQEKKEIQIQQLMDRIIIRREKGRIIAEVKFGEIKANVTIVPGNLLKKDGIGDEIEGIKSMRKSSYGTWGDVKNGIGLREIDTTDQTLHFIVHVENNQGEYTSFIMTKTLYPNAASLAIESMPSELAHWKATLANGQEIFLGKLIQKKMAEEAATDRPLATFVRASKESSANAPDHLAGIALAVGFYLASLDPYNNHEYLNCIQCWNGLRDQAFQVRGPDSDDRGGNKHFGFSFPTSQEVLGLSDVHLDKKSSEIKDLARNFPGYWMGEEAGRELVQLYQSGELTAENLQPTIDALKKDGRFFDNIEDLIKFLAKVKNMKYLVPTFKSVGAGEEVFNKIYHKIKLAPINVLYTRQQIQKEAIDLLLMVQQRYASN